MWGVCLNSPHGKHVCYGVVARENDSDGRRTHDHIQYRTQQPMRATVCENWWKNLPQTCDAKVSVHSAYAVAYKYVTMATKRKPQGSLDADIWSSLRHPGIIFG